MEIIAKAYMRTEAALIFQLLSERRDPFVLIQGEIRVATTLQGFAEFEWYVDTNIMGFVSLIPFDPKTDPLPFGLIATRCFCTIYATEDQK